MSNLKNEWSILIFLGLSLTVDIRLLPVAMAHGNISGRLVYTAEVPSLSVTDLMFTIMLGSNPQQDRTLIAGDQYNSTAYPQANNNGMAILCHAFPDTDQDGNLNLSTPVIGVLKPDGTDLTALTSPKQGAAYDATFSLDERHIAFAFADADTDGDGVITTHDKASLATKELGQVDPLNPTPRQFASNKPIKTPIKNANFSVEKPEYLTNNLIVFTGKSPVDSSTIVYMYDVSTDQLQQVGPNNSQTRNPALSKDGSQIAVEVVTLSENFAAIYDIASKTWARLPISPMSITSLAWSVDHTLALAMSDGTNWQIMLFDGTELRKLVEIPQKISSLKFSPDGKAIAYLWDSDGADHSVLAVATLDGGYNADVSASDSAVKDYDWIPKS